MDYIDHFSFPFSGLQFTFLVSPVRPTATLALALGDQFRPIALALEPIHQFGAQVWAEGLERFWLRAKSPSRCADLLIAVALVHRTHTTSFQNGFGLLAKALHPRFHFQHLPCGSFAHFRIGMADSPKSFPFQKPSVDLKRGP